MGKYNLTQKVSVYITTQLPYITAKVTRLLQSLIVAIVNFIKLLIREALGR